MAPITLVAAKLTPRRINDVKIVPSIPVKYTGIVRHIHLLTAGLNDILDNKSDIARYTTAIPNTTQEKAGVMVIIPIKVSMPAIIPIMIPATIERPAQLVLQ